MVDPLIHPTLFAAYLIAVGLLLVVPSARRWIRRRREKTALRGAILRWLNPGDEAARPDAASRARNKVEALVPCRLRDGRHSPQRRGFVCCSNDQVMVVSGSEVVRSLRYEDWRRLGLSEAYRHRSFRVALEDDGGALELEVRRADNLVRLVNVAANHSVAVGYLRA